MPLPLSEAGHGQGGDTDPRFFHEKMDLMGGGGGWPAQTRKSPIPVPPIPDLAGKRGRESPIPDSESAGIGNREPPFPDSVGNGNRGPDWPQIGKSGILLCVSAAAAIMG